MKKTLITKITLVGLCVCSLAGGIQTAMAQTGESVVNFTGSILDQGCTIDTTTKDQTIDFGSVSAASFTAAAATDSSTQPINIKLTGCPSTITMAHISISGTADTNDSNNLAITTGAGSTSGLSIKFRDLNNSPIDINQITDPGQPIVAGDNTLHYLTALTNDKGDGTGNVVTEGTISASAQYSITYE